MSLAWEENPTVLTPYGYVVGGGTRLVRFYNGSASGEYSDDDGDTWTPMSMPSASGWYGGFYSWTLGLYFAFTDSGDEYATSADGVSWTSRTFPVSYFGDIKLDENDTVVAAVSPSNDGVNGWYTADGVSWTMFTPGTAGIQDIAHNGTYWMIVTGLNLSSGTADFGYYYTTNIAGAWTGDSFPSDLTCARIAGGNGAFVALKSGGGGPAAFRCTTPTVWVATDAFLNSGSPGTDIVFTKNGLAQEFILTTNALANIYSSPTGIAGTWDAFALEDGEQPVFDATWTESVAYVSMISVGTGDGLDLRAVLEAAAVLGEATSGFAASSATSVMHVPIVIDNVVMNVAIDRLYTAVLRSIAAISGVETGYYEGTHSTADTVVFGSRLIYVLHGMALDTLVLNGDLSSSYTILGQAISRLLLSGEAQSFAEAVALIVDALVFRDVCEGLNFAQAIDIVALGDTIAATYAMVAAAVDRILMSGAVEGTNSLTAILRDAVYLTDEAAHQADLAVVLRDSVAFMINLSFEDGQYVAWVMNTESGGLSKYTNFPFNSYATIGGRRYGAYSGGIVKFGGDTDFGEAIQARLRLGMFDFNSRVKKSFSEVYIGAAGGELLLKCIYVDDGTGEKVAAVYRLQTRPAGASREMRFEPGKGLKAVDWDFEIENVDGADFDLRSVQFHPMMSSRRTRG